MSTSFEVRLANEHLEARKQIEAEQRQIQQVKLLEQIANQQQAILSILARMCPDG